MNVAVRPVADFAAEPAIAGTIEPNGDIGRIVLLPVARNLPAEPGSRWLGATVLSLAIHAVVAGAVLIDWRFHKPEPAAPPAAMMVDLAVLPSSPPETPTEVAPGPEQVEAAPAPKPLPAPKFDPPPQVDPALKPQFALPPKQPAQPVDAPNVAKEARETTAPPTINAPKNKDNQAPVEGSNAAPPSDAEQAWESRILARLERNKRYPSQAQSAGQEDQVIVRIVLDRKGRLVSSAVKKSRNFALLDREVLDLARRASPYPAPPESVTGNTVELVVPIEFFLKKSR